MPSARPDPAAVEALTHDLEKAGKYTTVAHDVLERTAIWALERYPGRKDAAKAARRKLHQVHAAFVTDRGMATAAGLVAELGDAADGEAVARVCRAVLRSHASTAEREPFVEDFYAAVFDGLDAPQRVVDLAAGLNPFTIPWMGLAAGVAYHASDIDHRFAALARDLAPHVDVALTASVSDLVGDPHPVTADVVLLFKTLPTLEQQARGAAARVLDAIDAHRVAVSFSACSLTGRRKGMPENYERMLDDVIGDSRWQRSERIAFPTETLYHLTSAGTIGRTG